MSTIVPPTTPTQVPDWARGALEDGTPFEVRPIDKATARDLIVREHYSHNWNTAFGVYCFGVFDGTGLAGALVYGYPMNPGSTGSLADLAPEQVTELNRMWIHDRLGPNTETAAMARAHRWLRTNSPVQLIQTFADGRLGVGTVYKAANFGYYGASLTLFYRCLLTGEVLHGVPFTSAANPEPMVARNARWARGELEPFRVKTYRYLYPLTKYARRRIVLDPEPYPTYQRGEEPLPSYVPPASQMARALVLAEAKGWRDHAGDIRAYMDRTYDAPAIQAALDMALRNEWVIPHLRAREEQPDLFDMLGEATA